MNASADDVVRMAARAFERDRFLAALLSPASVRADLIAVAAFAGELARIPSSVSEPMLGEIRLQWWRDALDAGLIEGATSSGHPVADAVTAVARRHKLPASLLHDLIDAQAARLPDRPFAHTNDLEANLAAWDGGLFNLAWWVMGGPHDGGTPVPRELLAAAGTLYGLARCLLEAPAELAQGRILLPDDLLAERGNETKSVDTTVTSEQWRASRATLVTNAEQRLSDIAERYQRASVSTRLAALPLALVRPYLRLCQRVDIAAMEAQDVGPLTRVWRLWLTSRTGRL